MLAVDQPHWDRSFVVEGAPQPYDLVDPRLECGGNPEVVHRGSDQEHVRDFELTDQQLAAREREAQGPVVPLGRAEGRRHPGVVHERGRLGVEVAVDDVEVGLADQPLRERLLAQLTRDRARSAGTRVEVKDVRHGSPQEPGALRAGRV